MTRSPTSSASLLAYSLPALPLAILGMPLIIYLPPFYATEIGLDLATVGVIFFLARAWDAVIDPLVGLASDRTRSRWGRRKPWLGFGTILLMIGVYAFLAPPVGIGKLYLAIVAFLFYVAWAVVTIPYQSWGAELSRDYAERTRITSWRETGTMIGVVLATLLPVVVLRAPDPSLRDILWVFVVALMVLLPLTSAVALALTPSPAPAQADSRGFGAALAVLARNKPLARLLAGVFCIWLGGSVYNAGLIFLFEHRLQLPRADFLKFVLLQYLLAIAFVPVWIRVATRIGKHRALVWGGFGFLALQPLFLLPAPGEFLQVLPIYFLIGPLSSVIWVMPPALVADTIEYGMLKGGGDDAALYLAIYNFAVKIALAGGVGIAMPLLGAFGFNAAGANDSRALSGLLFVTLVLPGMIALVGAAFLYHYPLDARRHALIRRWLSRHGKIPAN